MSLCKLMATTVLLGACLSMPVSAAVPATTTLKVTVDGQDKILVRFTPSPRASQTVMKALNELDLSTLDVHWQTSGLYDVSAPLALKQEALMRLANEEDFASMSQKPQWRQLRQAIRDMQFGQKVTTPIDPDRTRIDAEVNPLITGKWVLNLQTHPNSVFVFGNVKHMGKQPWQQRQDASFYAESAGLLTHPLSAITVIQPDGHIETHKVAYWNRNYQEVSPGSIVYIPMPHAHTWFDVEKTNVSTNQVIVDLLRNRLP